MPNLFALRPVHGSGQRALTLPLALPLTLPLPLALSLTLTLTLTLTLPLPLTRAPTLLADARAAVLTA